MTVRQLVIDLTNFKPVHCDEALLDALGYESVNEIREEFVKTPHLRNTSFIQLYKAGLNASDFPIQMLSRKGRLAGTVMGVTVNHDRTCLNLEIETGSEPAPLPERLILSLQLDNKMIITSVTAGDVDPTNFVGRDFGRCIAPLGWSKRLKHIYGDRLNRRNLSVLRHPTVFPGGTLQLALWRLERLPADSSSAFKADCYFHDTPEISNRVGLRMLMTNRGKRSEIAMDTELLSLAPLSLEILPPRLEDFLATVLPEDRQWVRQVLQHPLLPEDHELTYRIASQDGVVKALRQRISNLRQSNLGQGRGIVRRDSWLEVVSEEETANVSLTTLAIIFDLKVDAVNQNEIVRLVHFQQLGPFVSRLKAQLRSDGFKDDILLSIQPSKPCTLCDALSGKGNSLSLTLLDFCLSRSQLKRLMESDQSPFAVGRASSWKSWFSELHSAGFHLSIGLGDSEQVTIDIFGSD